MTDPRDSRIVEIEQELARFQTETIPCQAEATWARDRLKFTLQVAMRVLDRAADEFERTHDGFNGRPNG